jgi:hypothetical protein
MMEDMKQQRQHEGQRDVIMKRVRQRKRWERKESSEAKETDRWEKQSNRNR